MLPQHKKITYDEFLKLDKGDDLLEYIDGEVYLLSSPSAEHQRTLLNLATEFNLFFKGKGCDVFIAPFDVVLTKDDDKNIHQVQPDLMVICNKDGLKENKYIGVPDLIIEVMSPSNTSHDRIRKFNLYMRYGVKEYWLINPKFKTIEINMLNEEGFYEQVGVYKGEDIAKSVLFEDLEIKLEDIFS